MSHSDGRSGANHGLSYWRDIESSVLRRTSSNISSMSTSIFMYVPGICSSPYICRKPVTLSMPLSWVQLTFSLLLATCSSSRDQSAVREGGAPKEMISPTFLKNCQTVSLPLHLTGCFLIPIVVNNTTRAYQLQELNRMVSLHHTLIVSTVFPLMEWRVFR